jgi:hypothetical protein
LAAASKLKKQPLNEAELYSYHDTLKESFHDLPQLRHIEEDHY